MIEVVQKRISNAKPVTKQTGEKERSVSKRKQAIITFLSVPSKPMVYKIIDLLDTSSCVLTRS